MREIQHGTHRTRHATRNAQRSPRFTIEAVLWVLVLVVALILRLTDLGAAPLRASEAREAMSAWRAVTGQGELNADYSPLLLALNTLLFTLCGTSDALARLWPALFGGLLALTPLLLRRRLGRVGALAAALYLAISPTALVASRQVDGAVIAAAGVMLFLGGLVRFWDAEQRSWLTLSAGGLALAFTSSSSAYGLLVPLILAYLITFYVLRFTRDASRFAPYASHFSLVFIVAALVFATGLGWNLSGVGAVGGLLANWFARFRSVADPVVSPFTLLIAYEPLALLFGLGGLIWAVWRRRRFGALLGLWAGLAFLLLLLMPGRSSLDLLWVVLPLGMLAGLAVEALAHGWRASQGRLVGIAPLPLQGVYISIVLILWVLLYLVLARYAVFGDTASLMLALLLLFSHVVLALGFSLTIGVASALRGVAVGTGVVLLAFTLSVGWGAAHGQVADPREVLVHQPTDVGVRDLIQTLQDLSWRETGLPTALAFTYEAAPDSVLAWHLRGFSAARRVERLGNVPAGEMDPVLVTSGQELALGDDAEYTGQDFALRRHWTPREVGCSLWGGAPRCSAVIGWFLFRDTPALPEAEQRVTLWIEPSLFER